MSTHPAATAQIASQSRNPLEVARSHLIRRLLELQVPKAFANFPIPSDFEVVADHIREASAIFDEWLAAVGFQVADNATTRVDMNCFEGAFTGAIEGNATFCCQFEAEELRADRSAMRRAS